MTLFFLAIAIIIFLLLIEVPVGFAFGIGALAFGYMQGTDVSFHTGAGYSQVNAFSLLAIPLFVLSGTLMGATGISERLLDFVNSFVGRTKGGLGAVTVVTCALFGAISGSASAAIAAIGKIMVPRMIKEGYPPGHATALVAVSSVLALMIPPSIPMIVFAIAIRESVAKAFLATMGPGIMLAIIYCGLNFWFLRKNTTITVAESLSFGDTVKEIGRTGKRASLAIIMPIIILGGIYSGIATPTEAGSMALVYTLAVGLLIYRTLPFNKLFDSTVEAARLTGAILMVLFFLFIMSRGMVLAKVPTQFADMLLTISDNKIVILLLINLLLLIMGMIIDDVSGGVLAAIILLPVTQKIGLDPIHFAAIVGTNLGLGNVSPPCAPLLYMAGGVTRQPLSTYVGPTMKFLLLGHLPMVFIVTFVPPVALFLPGLLD
ncbi:Sialic acid TRAP transporter permease protein SiaT [Falsiruegeria litorea R37]|uniref:TRAP transporter large permease protein n=1 Tax=Falsiruegeria litorea R37 TaxID=1200284 RepID=A0A1Y5TTI1_9RHOB|nr:TRAP transporter large permease [Falsiruegeria litorea]SLN72286.1 Sialic acid TRAP transporter permease protein SiaT [Falsiruegeria litorea R37]